MSPFSIPFFAAGSNSTVCTDCLCTITLALVPAYVAGGVKFNPQDPTSLDIGKITDISTACATALAPQIAAALGAKASLLAGLTECPLVTAGATGNVTAESLPECLTVEALTAAFASANKTASLNATGELAG